MSFALQQSWITRKEGEGKKEWLIQEHSACKNEFSQHLRFISRMPFPSAPASDVTGAENAN